MKKILSFLSLLVLFSTVSMAQTAVFENVVIRDGLWIDGTWHTDLSSGGGSGADTLPYKLPEDHVFFLILAGQSNMDGRIDTTLAGIDSDLLDSWPNAYIFQSGSGLFENLDVSANNNVVNAYPAGGRYGPEVYLAKYFDEYFNGNEVYMAKYAEGGTIIAKHLPGGEFYDELWDDTVIPALQEVIDLGKIPVITFLWLQGESDANTLSDAQEYHLRLDTLINTVRTNLHKNTPIHFAKISAPNAYKDTINDAFDSRQHLIDNIGVVNSSDYTRFDGSHFDDEGLSKLTKGYIHSMLAMGNLGVPLYNWPIKDLATILEADVVSPVYVGTHADTTVNLAYSKIHRLDLGAASTDLNITFENATDGERYTLAWFNNTPGVSLSFPNTMYCNDGSTEGNFASTSSTAGTLDFYYDGTSEQYYISSSQPGCSASYESEYVAVLDYMSINGITQPHDSVKTLQNNLVKNLKSQGILSQLDVLYVMATDDQRAACINWINPNGDSLAINNATFTPNVGFFGVTATDAAVTSEHLLNAGAVYSALNQGIFWYSADSSTVSGTRIIEESDNNDLVVQLAGGSSFIRFPNDNSTNPFPAKPTGWFQLTNVGSLADDKSLYKDGLELSMVWTSGGTAEPDSQLRLLEGGASQSMSVFAAGGAMEDKAVIFNTIISNYTSGLNIVAQ